MKALKEVFWILFWAVLAMGFISYCIIEGTKNWAH